MKDLYQRIEAAIRRMAEDPRGAAEQLRNMAKRLEAAADILEKKDAERWQSRGGLGDRVQMQLIGPDGKIKHSTDTEHN